MRVLFHICCGPCAIVPLREFMRDGHELSAAFINPNIHPFLEYQKRLEGAQEVLSEFGVELAFQDPYGLHEFMRAVVFHEDERCPICYRMRLGRIAEHAGRGGFDAFSTSMLISTHQNHEAIARTGEQCAREHGIAFLYRDFRPDVMEGVRLSRQMGLYRQQYCGCVYSEWERYAKRRKARG